MSAEEPDFQLRGGKSSGDGVPPLPAARLKAKRAARGLNELKPIPLEMRSLPVEEQGLGRAASSEGEVGGAVRSASGLVDAGGAKRSRKSRRLELRTIPPPLPLTGGLRDLYGYLKHQDVDDGAAPLRELRRLDEGRLQQRVREFENLQFRLSQDEDKEMQRGLALGILHGLLDYPEKEVGGEGGEEAK